MIAAFICENEFSIIKTPAQISKVVVRSWKGGILFLTYLGKVSLSRELDGYPQALLKVINLQGMLELSEILILVRNPPLCPNVNNVP